MNLRNCHVNCLATWETAKLQQIKLFFVTCRSLVWVSIGTILSVTCHFMNLTVFLSRALDMCLHDLAHESLSNTYDFTSLSSITFSMSYEKHKKHQNVCIIDYRECPKPSHSWIYRISSSLLCVTLFKLEYVYIRAINECDKSERDSKWSEWSGEITAKWNKNELLISLFDFYFHCEFIHLASLGEWEERTWKKLFLVFGK
jgi:hypothetical protein